MSYCIIQVLDILNKTVQQRQLYLQERMEQGISSSTEETINRQHEGLQLAMDLREEFQAQRRDDQNDLTLRLLQQVRELQIRVMELEDEIFCERMGDDL